MNMTVNMNALKSSTRINSADLPLQDQALANRYAKFVKAREAVMAARKLPMTDLSTGTDVQRQNHRAWERLLDKAHKEGEAIAKTPAHTIEGMLLKIRVFGYIAGNHNATLDELDRWEGGDLIQGEEETSLITTLRSDLLRLQGGPPELLQSAKSPCPVLPLAIEASNIIAAWNAIDERKGDGKEQPRDDRRHEVLTDRLDAVQEAASFLVPTSDDGAAFQLALAAGIHDLLITSTFAADCVKVSHERRCARLLAAATAYMMTRRVTKANKWWPQVSGYFGGYLDMSPYAVCEAIQSAGVTD